MKPKNHPFAFLFVLLLSLSLACSSLAPQPTETPIPSNTPTITPSATPEPTATPTVTPSPTATATPLHSSSVTLSEIAPRWAMLGQPGNYVGILGKWWAPSSGWYDSPACAGYILETHIYLQQCFALADKKFSFDSLQAPFVMDFAVLKPSGSFENINQRILYGKSMVENGTKYLKFFEVVEAGKYVMSVEMNIVTSMNDLQTAYQQKAAPILNYVLQNMLARSQLIATPTATPLSPEQVIVNNDLTSSLITEDEVNALYQATSMKNPKVTVPGTWMFMGDKVDQEYRMVSRMFEDRTSADTRWVVLENSVFDDGQTYFDDFVQYYEEGGDIKLSSSHQYPGDFAVFGMQNELTFIRALLHVNGRLYMVVLEVRTLPGESIKTVFNQTADDFIYNVLSINASR